MLLPRLCQAVLNRHLAKSKTMSCRLLVVAAMLVLLATELSILPKADRQRADDATTDITTEASAMRRVTSNKSAAADDSDTATKDRLAPREDGDIRRIDKHQPPPSAKDIAAIFVKENDLLEESGGGEGWNATTIEKMSNVYELTYAFVANFQRRGIHILLSSGSHIGARRHHGIIPFGEKDIDFHIFSLDEKKTLSIIEETLRSYHDGKWSTVKVDEKEFGYQVRPRWMADQDSSHYIDFFLFGAYDDAVSQRRKIKCVGRDGDFALTWGSGERFKKGCDWWYTEYFDQGIPTFDYEDFFPVIYQVFGTHKVPIPRKSTYIETFQYDGPSWNTTCGSHRTWNGEWWEDVPLEKRRCRDRYDRYPFVFRGENGKEELRQAGVVIHRSTLP